MIEIEDIIIVMDTEGGVTDEMVAFEGGFENFEILLLVFFCDFGVIENFNLVLVVGDGLIDRSEFLVDFSDVFLASDEKIEAVTSQKDIPGKESFGGELLVFEQFVALFKGFFVTREMGGIIAVELGKNTIEVGAATCGSVIDQVEV